MLKLVQPGSMMTSGIEITAAGVIVGRERGCDLMLCSKNVSRQHARVVLQDKIACVEDLGSSNGTFVDGQPIKELTPLKPGCSVAFGDLTFFLIDDVPAVPRDPLSGDTNTSRRDPLPLPQPPAASIAESKPVRRFAIRAFEREKATPPKSGPRPTLKSNTPKLEHRLVSSSSVPAEKNHAWEVCAGLLLVLLVSSFALGKGVGRLGSRDFFGERQAMQNLMTPEPVEEVAPPETGQTPDSASVAPSTKAQANPGAKPNQTAPAPSPLDSPSTAAVANLEPENPGEMSINDSGKALKLMKEAQKLNIDMRDQEAVFRIATERLGMTRDQAKRAVSFVTVMAERKAIMDGGVDAIAKIKPAPRTTPPASSVPVVTSVPSTPQTDANVPDQPRPDSPPSNLSQQVPSATDPKSAGTDTTERVPTGSNDQQPPKPPAVVMAPIHRGTGFYLNTWGLALVTGMLIVWRVLVTWMGRDAERLGETTSTWLDFCTLAGPAGALVMLACPDLGWGTLLNTAFFGLPFMAHLANREQKVPPHLQVLRLQNWFGVQDTSDFDADQTKPTNLEFLKAATEPGPSDTAAPIRVSDKPGLLAAKSLLGSAIARRASDIQLQPEQEQFLARFLIDGRWRDAGTYSQSAGQRLWQVFTQAASPDRVERRGSPDGRFRVRISDESFDVRTVPDPSRPQTLSLRLLRFQEELTNFSGLGCNRKIQGELRDLISLPQGLILFCGPGHSGKSTTLRSAVSELDSTVQKIIAVEDRLDYRMANIIQLELDRNAGQTMGTLLKTALQQEPGTLVVGEIQDRETAITACHAAKHGHLVLSSIKAGDAVGAIRQLSDWGVESSAIADALTAVLGQRLLRRLCPICKLRYDPEAELLRRYRIPNDRDRVLFKPPGETSAGGSTCEACEGEGYRGRVGIFELLKIDDPIQTLIRDGASPNSLKETARRKGMVPLRESGFLVALRGVTSLEEVDTVTRTERE